MSDNKQTNKQNAQRAFYKMFSFFYCKAFIFRLNLLDHRVPEIEAFQNIYRLVGFEKVPNLPVFGLQPAG